MEIAIAVTKESEKLCTHCGHLLGLWLDFSLVEQLFDVLLGLQLVVITYYGLIWLSAGGGAEALYRSKLSLQIPVKVHLKSVIVIILYIALVQNS